MVPKKWRTAAVGRWRGIWRKSKSDQVHTKSGRAWGSEWSDMHVAIYFVVRKGWLKAPRPHYQENVWSGWEAKKHLIVPSREWRVPPRASDITAELWSLQSQKLQTREWGNTTVGRGTTRTCLRVGALWPAVRGRAWRCVAQGSLGAAESVPGNSERPGDAVVVYSFAFV